ncbi:MAG: hypothetical protein R3F51_20400 [Cyanobacteriota/Melainabacteria group bacterium]
MEFSALSFLALGYVLSGIKFIKEYDRLVIFTWVSDGVIGPESELCLAYCPAHKKSTCG